jgi:LPXTG-site transpeptidase (sortase) family protein
LTFSKIYGRFFYQLKPEMSTYTLTERDIRLFLQEAPAYKGRFRYALPVITGICASLVLSMVALSVFQPQELNANRNPVVLPMSDARLAEDVQAAAPTPEPTPTPLPVTIPDDTFAVSELGISAPIVWNVAFEERVMNKALESGVIHLNGTAVPGQQGMSAIAGHSSNLPWARGQFNTVFASLTKAKEGQLFEINYNDTMYQYRVTKVYEVRPTDVQILNDHSRTGIRLITCTPLGTSLRRLIVEADQVFPDPKFAAPFTPSNLAGTLPKDR